MSLEWGKPQAIALPYSLHSWAAQAISLRQAIMYIWLEKVSFHSNP